MTTATVPTEDECHERELAVKAVMAETDCTKQEAEELLALITVLTTAAKQDENGIVILTDEQLGSDAYYLLDEVMPHGSESSPGTAHEHIERLIGVRLIHDEQSFDAGLLLCTIVIRTI